MSFVRLSQSMEAVQLFPEEGKRQTVCSAGTAGIVDVLKVPACNFLNHGTVLDCALATDMHTAKYTGKVLAMEKSFY